MDLFLIFILSFSGLVLYCAGHWVGYGKGVKDTEEFAEQIDNLNTSHNTEFHGLKKANRVKNFR